MKRELRIEEIRKATLNGRKVKIFSVRELVDGAWLFVGAYSAPQRTPNKDLLAQYELRSPTITERR